MGNRAVTMLYALALGAALLYVVQAGRRKTNESR